MNNKPLVSVICRSIGRSELSDALLSLKKQSYENLEVILVDALGTGIDSELLSVLNGTPSWLNTVSSGKRLTRSPAANLGLSCCKGDYIIFLDEDDWIAPSHIEKLISCLETDESIGVAYSSTRVCSKEGVYLDESYASAFSYAKLRRGNFIPIHSAVFRASLVQDGTTFDDSLDLFEDWDFWLQLAEKTNFKHIELESAYYRQGGDSAVQVDDDADLYKPSAKIAQARARLLEKWKQRWSGVELNETFGSLDKSREIAELHQKLRTANNENLLAQNRNKILNSELKTQHDLSNELAAEVDAQAAMLETKAAMLEASELQLRAKHQSYRVLEQHLITLQRAHEDLDKGVKEILSSFSWRVTAPYRFLSLRARRLLSGSGNTLKSELQQTSIANGTSVCAELVTPGEHSSSFLDAVEIQGWAWSPQQICEIEIFVNSNQYAQENLAQALAALNKASSAEEAARIGFVFKVPLGDLSPGDHQLTVRVNDSEGESVEFQRSFLLLDSEIIYREWLLATQPSAAELQHQRDSLSRVGESSDDNPPSVNFLLDVGDDFDTAFATVKSLIDQSYRNWTLYLLSSADAIDHRKILSLDSDRIRSYSDVGEVIADCLKSEESYTGFLAAGEILSPSLVWALLANCATSTDLVYFDHDSLSDLGFRQNPVFNFGWSPQRLFADNCVGDLYFLSKRILATYSETQWPILENYGRTAGRYELLLSIADKVTSPKHIAGIYWTRMLSASDHSDAITEKETAAVSAFVERSGLDANLIVNEKTQTRYLSWSLKEEPLVSIVIPTTGNMKYLRPCIESITEHTSYNRIELVVLDNGRGKHPEGIKYLKDKNIKTIECNEAFNWSKLNNIGAENASGEVFLFLNDDIEVIDKHWITEMLRQVQRDDVGIVGNLLLYPNGAIQHAGVFLVDHGGGARHFMLKFIPHQANYLNLDKIVRETTAVTGACMMISRDRFNELGGFDEKLPIVGNDIDLCLRSIDAGYKNIWTPQSKLIHHESVSREHHPISADERAMWKKWEHYFIRGDYYYNSQLSLTHEDCRIGDFKPGKSESSVPQPPYPPGVNLIAYIRAEMGVGEASRGNALALTTTDIAFGIINFEARNPAAMGNLSWHSKEIYQPVYDINLIHINADYSEFARESIGFEHFDQRYNIGFWVWELPEFPDRWLSAFQGLDEIWVPSEFVKSAISAKSPIPVHVIPHVVEEKSIASDIHLPITVTEECFYFLSMFDSNSVSERKNPFGAIDAFKVAFEPGDNSVRLIVKANNAEGPLMQRLISSTREYNNIEILDTHLDREEIDYLISQIDCFVSLHRSEGFGLVPAEAMAMGKATLLTAWSGNTDYMTPDNCRPVAYKLTPLGQDFGPYDAHQEWAEPDLQDAAAGMKELVQDPERVRQMGDNARITISSLLSAKVVGAKMMKRIEMMRADQGTK